MQAARRLSIIVMTCLFSMVFAHPNPVHTWHTIKSTNGEWQGKLQMLNETGNFVTPQGNLLNAFRISTATSQDYGFSFDRDVDFDVAYTLTLTQKSNGDGFFQSKACVYVITAAGPANPDIRASAFNGAICHYTVISGRGENFEVS